MNGCHKIGLFRVYKQEDFRGEINFDIKPKIFLTYDKAYEYVRESFKCNHRPMPWDSRYFFEYERENPDKMMVSLLNGVHIEMILPFYLHIGREWC